MNNVSRLVFCAAVLALVCGCANREPRMLRIGVDYLGATPREVAEDVAYAIEFPLIGISDVESITCISSEGALEAYVAVAPTGDPTGDPTDLLQQVRLALQGIEDLPADADALQVELLPVGVTIPPVEFTEIDTIVLHINDKTTTKLGIRPRTIAATIREHTAGRDLSEIPLEELQAIRVSAPDGSDVPVSELAEVTIEKEPSHIVTRWPREVPAEAAEATLDAKLKELR